MTEIPWNHRFHTLFLISRNFCEVKVNFCFLNTVRLNLNSPFIFRTSERINGCDKCDADFKNESVLEYHKSTKSYEKGVSRNCPNCSFKFCERTTLNRHLREVHKLKTIKNEPLDAEPGEKVRKWVCDKCDYAYYNSSHLDDHQKSKGNFLAILGHFSFKI